jgi:hypothetical protein
MEDKEKQIKEEPKDPKQAENLSEAELEKAVGGATYNTTKSNVKTNA